MTSLTTTSDASLPPAPHGLPPRGVVRLTHWGVIEATGEDSIKFLNSQLSNDLNQLSPTQARLAAFCSAKGRMQASFVAVQLSNGAVLLLCSQDLLTATLKRLSMFVMRAKTKLRDATADFPVYGLLGASALPSSEPANTPWSAFADGEAAVVQLYPTQGLARQLWVADTTAAPPAGPALALADWQCGEVLSGVATVSAAVVEAFVPQMLNYESVGGVSFKKGCYPGQEVVARSQFRGTLKRRAYVVSLSNVQGVAAAVAGQEVFSSQDPDQPCGAVVQAAQGAQGEWLAIVSMQTSAAEQGSLHLGAPDGSALSVLPLPYALLEDI